MARSTSPTKGSRASSGASSAASKTPSSRARKPAPAPKRYVGDTDKPPVAARAWLGLAHATGGLFLEKSDELRKYNLIFDAIRSSALSTEESRNMIVMLAEEPLWNLRPRVSGST